MFYWPLQSWEEGLGGEEDEGRIENRLKSPPQGLDQDWDEVRRLCPKKPLQHQGQGQKGEEDGLSGECEHDPAMPHNLSISHNPLQHSSTIGKYNPVIYHNISSGIGSSTYQKINSSDQHEKNLFFNRMRFQMSGFSS